MSDEMTFATYLGQLDDPKKEERAQRRIARLRTISHRAMYVSETPKPKFIEYLCVSEFLPCCKSSQCLLQEEEDLGQNG